MKTVKDYIEDLTQLLPDEKKIVESKKKKDQESYEQYLLSSLNEDSVITTTTRERESSLQDVYKEFKNVVANIGGNTIEDKLKRLAEFTKSVPEDASIQEQIALLQTVNSLKSIIDNFEATGGGFMFEQFLSALVGQDKLPPGSMLDDKFKYEDVSDFRGPNKDGFSAKFLANYSLSVSLRNLIASVHYYSKQRRSLMYIMGKKDFDNNQIVLRRFVLVDNGIINETNFKALTTASGAKKFSSIVNNIDLTNEDSVKEGIDKIGKGSTKIEKGVGNLSEKMGTIDLNGIEKILKKNRESILGSVQQISNYLKGIEINVNKYYADFEDETKRMSATKAIKEDTDGLYKTVERGFVER